MDADYFDDFGIESDQDISNSFEADLGGYPEILKYINRLQGIIINQRNLLIKLKITQNRIKPTKDGWCQTEESYYVGYEAGVAEGYKKAREFQNKYDYGGAIEENDKWGPGVLSSNLAEQVKEAAESALQQTGFVYEATSGMYYDYKTGYYYNAEQGLYYDGNSGTYLYYDEERQQYLFHSKIETPVDPECVQHLVDLNKRKSVLVKNNKGPKKLRKSKPPKKCLEAVKLEEGECTESSEEEEMSEGEECNKNKTDHEQILPLVSKNAIREESQIDEAVKVWPPSMRVIVQETGLGNLSVGTLFLVTCKGGTLGREGDHAVLIPDINISKYHAKLDFCGGLSDSGDGHYRVLDLGSRNGTYVDGKRLSVALQESDPAPLGHGSVIRVGSTSLLCHVHIGAETCLQCEPGCMVPQNSVKAVPEVVHAKLSEKRKQELMRLRKRFGLKGNKEVSLAPGYQDRAEERRKTVGSSSDSDKTQVASVHESIPSDNKGFKMLSKMGWSKGEALGKSTSSGIIDPLAVEERRNRSGLGSDASLLPASTARGKRKAKLWRKTQERYNNIS